MAAAIDVVCPKLVSAGFAGASSATGDLTRRCREMRQTANANQSSGATTFSLGLTNDQLASALGALTPDQASTAGTGAIETGIGPSRAIAGRLSALRQGARGVSVSGLHLDQDGKPVSIAQLIGLDGPAGGSADRGGAGAIGVFLNGAYGFGDRDATARESGFDFNSGLVTAGVDYRFSDSFIAGVALSYAHSDADLKARLGDVETNSYGLAVYGTFYVGQFYLDSLLGFGWNTYDLSRRISYAAGPGAGAGAAGVVVDRTAKADTEGPQYTATVGAGYEFRGAGFTMTPFLRAEFVGLNIDGYTESGAGGLDLKVKSQDVYSLQTALGGQLGYAFSTPIGVLVPYVRMEWRHEFLDNERNVTAKYANDPFNVFFSIPTDKPDRDFMGLAAGISNQFKGGVSAFLNYETVLGLKHVDAHMFTAGVRIEF
jgi:outer membrane autotransporter protein